MDQIFDIELILDGDKLTVMDRTMPTLLENNLDAYFEYYVNVEFLANRTEDNILPNVLITRPTYQTVVISEFDIDYNGIYYYYKLGIPIIDYFINKNVLNMIGEVYIDSNGALMQIVEKPRTASKIDIINASAGISYLDAYNAIVNNLRAESEANESYFFIRKEFFSTSKIRKCLVDLQHKTLLEGCSFDSCTSSANLRNTRDFLFSALYVLDYLKETENFEEAQRIIDNLSTCGFPCADDSITVNDCGCGNFI